MALAAIEQMVSNFERDTIFGGDKQVVVAKGSRFKTVNVARKGFNNDSSDKGGLGGETARTKCQILSFTASSLRLRIQ